MAIYPGGTEKITDEYTVTTPSRRVTVFGSCPSRTPPRRKRSGRSRVNRIHTSTGGAQRGDQQTPRGLDRHGNRDFFAVAGLGQHLQQCRESFGVVTDPTFGDQLTLPVNQGNVVMLLCPVDPARHGRLRLHLLPPHNDCPCWSQDPGENARRANSEAQWPVLRWSRSRSQQPARLRSDRQSSKLAFRRVSTVRAGLDHEHEPGPPRKRWRPGHARQRSVFREDSQSS